VLDATGNLKAVQKLLGHSSIQTTGDIYADWDFPRENRKRLQISDFMETAGIEPASAIA